MSEKQEDSTDRELEKELDLPAGMENYLRNSGNSSNIEDTRREEISQAEINRLYRMKEKRNQEARKGNEKESRQLDQEIQNYQKVLKIKYGQDCLKDTKLSELTAYKQIIG
jgi:arsenate reductase-like glutaredoxin family protein